MKKIITIALVAAGLFTAASVNANADDWHHGNHDNGHHGGNNWHDEHRGYYNGGYRYYHTRYHPPVRYVYREPYYAAPTYYDPYYYPADNVFLGFSF